jgi:hypothetical protein
MVVQPLSIEAGFHQSVSAAPEEGLMPPSLRALPREDVGVQSAGSRFEAPSDHHLFEE